MSEEVKNNEFTFENPAYRQTYWHTCSHVTVSYTHLTLPTNSRV